jgi:hypothetical protein
MSITASIRIEMGAAGGQIYLQGWAQKQLPRRCGMGTVAAWERLDGVHFDRHRQGGGAVKYTTEHLQRAKNEELPLFKIELDFRHAKKLGNGTKQLQKWGTCSPEIAAKLRQILHED